MNASKDELSMSRARIGGVIPFCMKQQHMPPNGQRDEREKYAVLVAAASKKLILSAAPRFAPKDTSRLIKILGSCKPLELWPS